MNGSLVAQRLKQIQVCCEELQPLLSVPFEAFRKTPAHYRLAERDIQLVVDSAVDVNNHLLVEARQSPPEKYYETFLALGRTSVLPRPLAERLARTTGLRNRIVHEYERVDLEIVHRALRAFVRSYAEYIRLVRRHVGL